MDEQARREMRTLLQQGAWFSALPAALQERILRSAVVRSYAKGQMFQVEGTPVAGLTAVIEGRVLILVHVNHDEPALIHVGGPGFWFGEIGVLMGDTALVTAVAQTATTALVLPKAALERIVADDPRSYPAFARMVFDRYRILMRFLAEARRLGADDRLRLRLADLAELRRLDTSVAGRGVELDITQSQLAAMVGLSRPKLNARLRAIQKEGWVELRPRSIRVLDADGLRATALARLSPQRRRREAS